MCSPLCGMCQYMQITHCGTGVDRCRNYCVSFTVKVEGHVAGPEDMDKSPAVTDAQALPAACGCVLFCSSKYVGL